MTTHPQEAVAYCAYQIWEDSGRPSGREDAIWYEAERTLRAGPAGSGAGPTTVAGVVPSLGESQSEHALAETAAHQRKEARAPITAKKTALKAKTPETGKPLWNQPHSR